jgi:hypothetical protein
MTKAPDLVHLEVGERVFAFGAHWVTLRPNQHLANEAIDDAAKSKATHAAVRTRPRQYGLGTARSDAGPSLVRPWYSAAATIAGAGHGAVLGAWIWADGRTWLLAAASTGILPEGDCVYPTPEEARVAFDQLRQNTSWRRIYAPPDWSVPNASPEPLAGLLKTARERRFLVLKVPTSTRFVKPPSKVTRFILPASAVLGASVIAVTGFYVLRPKKVVQTVREGPPPPTIPRWIPVADTVALCEPIIYVTAPEKLRIPGFDLISTSCSNTSASVESLALQSFPQTSINFSQPDARLQDDGRTVKTDIPLIQPAASAQLSQGHVRASARIGDYYASQDRSKQACFSR